MKNILFFSSNISNSGGTERIAIGLANDLVARGYRVSVLSIYGNSNPFFKLANTIPLLTLKQKHVHLPLIYPWVVFKLRSFVKKNKIDIVIDIGTMLSLITIPATIKTGAKTISWEHFNFSLAMVSKKEKLARVLAAKYADAIVLLTNTDASLFKANLKCNAKMEVIPNFLTIETERAPLATKTALAIGRLTYQKGFDNLLEIWKYAVKDNGEWVLVIVGDGEDRDKLVALIEKHELSSSVTIIPKTKDIAHYYRNSSLLLVTSRWEGLPMVMIEAQSFGLPIISFDCLTGPRDIIAHNLNGILVENGEIHEFSKALTSLWRDQERLSRMGGQAFIDSKRFNRNAILEKWIALFNKM